MAQITPDEFKNFFKYYAEEPHQQEAIEQLFVDLDPKLRSEKAKWIRLYRSKKEEEAAPWPITKDQMAHIMGCSAESLNDALMDDYARCVKTFDMDTLSQVYFLGQCGHESAGLRYPMEIHDGSNYEGRKDLHNIYPGDGVKFAGTGWIQVTGRYNHQAFSDYLDTIGQSDYRVMDTGKTYTSEVYPWTISGFWWMQNLLVAIAGRHELLDPILVVKR